MLLLRLFRFLFGYVCLSARGGFPERFVNLCANGSVNLWNLHSSKGVLYACADRNSYKRIRPAAKKSGMRVRIEDRRGLPFFLAKHRRRMGIVIGTVVFGLIIFSLSTRIWSINVTGNNAVSSQAILEVFEELGVKSGVKRGGINISKVEKAALERLGDISWLNINISGSSALIEVRELVKIPGIDTDNSPADIVALRDGQLVTLRVFSGTAERKTGGAVLKGDLLISGTEFYKDGSVEFCRATGYAVARTSRTIKTEAGDSTAFSTSCVVRRRFSLGFLMFDIPLGRLAPPEGTVRYANTKGIKIKNTVLPVSITEYRYYKSDSTAPVLTPEEERLAAQSDFYDRYVREFRYLTVEKQSITVIQNDLGAVARGKFICLENIGQSKPMTIEESPEPTTEATVE